SSENVEFRVNIDSDNDGDIDSTAEFEQENQEPNSESTSETGPNPSETPTMTGDDFEHALDEQNPNRNAAVSGGTTFFGLIGILTLLIVATLAAYCMVIAHRSGYNRDETIRNLEATITSLIGRMKNDGTTESSIPPVPPGFNTLAPPGISTQVAPPPPSLNTLPPAAAPPPPVLPSGWADPPEISMPQPPPQSNVQTIGDLLNHLEVHEETPTLETLEKAAEFELIWDEMKDEDSDVPPATIEQVELPTEAALNKMKKPVLVELAKLRNIPSSGTKDEIIARLLG
ncbi:MAG: SAP domain-containing protein, partial [Candidatus Poseidoniales archaeon]|nr:SAP domain-containing protein [Candidatus Poseidoniales archaeon]